MSHLILFIAAPVLTLVLRRPSHLPYVSLPPASYRATTDMTTATATRATVVKSSYRPTPSIAERAARSALGEMMRFAYPAFAVWVAPVLALIATTIRTTDVKRTFMRACSIVRSATKPARPIRILSRNARPKDAVLHAKERGRTATTSIRMGAKQTP